MSKLFTFFANKSIISTHAIDIITYVMENIGISFAPKDTLYIDFKGFEVFSILFKCYKVFFGKSYISNNVHIYGVLSITYHLHLRTCDIFSIQTFKNNWY